MGGTVRFGDTYLRALGLIGILVVAVLDHDAPDGVVSGILRTVDEYGEITIETRTGVRRCWPLLHIEPAGQAHL